MAIQMTQPTPKRVNRYRCAGCGAKMSLQQLCDVCRAKRQAERERAAIGFWLPTLHRFMDGYLAQYEAGLPIGRCACGQIATILNGLVQSDHLDDPMCAACYAKDEQEVQAFVARLEARRASYRQPDPEPPEPTTPAAMPLVAEPVKLYLRGRWERKSRYHQAASARRASKRGIYVVNRADEWADWNGWDGGAA